MNNWVFSYWDVELDWEFWVRPRICEDLFLAVVCLFFQQSLEIDWEHIYFLVNKSILFKFEADRRFSVRHWTRTTVWCCLSDEVWFIFNRNIPDLSNWVILGRRRALCPSVTDVLIWGLVDFQASVRTDRRTERLLLFLSAFMVTGHFLGAEVHP